MISTHLNLSLPHKKQLMVSTAMVDVWIKYGQDNNLSASLLHYGNLQPYNLSGNYKLLGPLNDDGEPLADDAWIIIRSRIKRVPFLLQAIRESIIIKATFNINYNYKCKL